MSSEIRSTKVAITETVRTPATRYSWELSEAEVAELLKNKFEEKISRSLKGQEVTFEAKINWFEQEIIGFELNVVIKDT